MKDAVNIMLDLETLGHTANAAIVAIGAVHFCFEQGKVLADFSRNITLSSALHKFYGGEVTAGTLEWWLRQEGPARTDFLNNGIHLNHALSQFTEWVETQSSGEKGKVLMWGNGADFDNAILSTAYQRIGTEPPWNFWNNRCYRTVKNLFPMIKFKPSLKMHIAVNDAYNQAEHLIKIIDETGILDLT